MTKTITVSTGLDALQDASFCSAVMHQAPTGVDAVAVPTPAGVRIKFEGDAEYVIFYELAVLAWIKQRNDKDTP